MNRFINFIKEYITISKDLEQSILAVSKIEKVEKNTTLLTQGKTCKKMYFLISGSVRSYFYQKGKEVTHWIYAPNSLFTSWSSYILQTPSNEYIETIDDCEIISISYDNW